MGGAVRQKIARRRSVHGSLAGFLGTGKWFRSTSQLKFGSPACRGFISAALPPMAQTNGLAARIVKNAIPRVNFGPAIDRPAKRSVMLSREMPTLTELLPCYGIMACWNTKGLARSASKMVWMKFIGRHPPPLSDERLSPSSAIP
jgi:hypothetical protein